MIYQVKDMVRDVKVAIDMNSHGESLLKEGDLDTLSLDEIIMAILCDAVRLVEMESPPELLENGHDFGEDYILHEDGSGMIKLPEDFMRLVAFRMSDWRRTIFDAISDRDAQYQLQSSRWKGIKGNPEKPVVAIVRRSEGKVLEFYSSTDPDAEIAQATYIPYPHIDQDGGIDISEECYRASVYRAAALALASVGDQLSNTMLEISKSLLQ